MPLTGSLHTASSFSDPWFIKVVVSRLTVLLTIHAHLLEQQRGHKLDKTLFSGDLLGIYFVLA